MLVQSHPSFFFHFLWNLEIFKFRSQAFEGVAPLNCCYFRLDVFFWNPLVVVFILQKVRNIPNRCPIIFHITFCNVFESDWRYCHPKRSWVILACPIVPQPKNHGQQCEFPTLYRICSCNEIEKRKLSVKDASIATARGLTKHFNWLVSLLAKRFGSGSLTQTYYLWLYFLMAQVDKCLRLFLCLPSIVHTLKW